MENYFRYLYPNKERTKVRFIIVEKGMKKSNILVFLIAVLSCFQVSSSRKIILKVYSVVFDAIRGKQRYYVEAGVYE